MKTFLKLYLISLIFILNPSIFSQTKYNFEDGKSSTLAKKAWACLIVKDWEGVEAYTEKCFSLYTKQALKQQSSLRSLAAKDTAANYWALNDVATCYYIQAKSLKEQGKLKEAKTKCKIVIEEYSFAQCWDTNGWFWSVADACKDLITSLGTNIDFGDYTSETLTRKAWESLGADSLSNTVLYANKCITLYAKDAAKQQSSLNNYATKEHAFDYWALNDVGTCYFILGEAYSKAKEWENAVKSYKQIIDKYSFAQCWDPRAWFWKPAVASRGKLNKIMSEQGIS